MSSCHPPKLIEDEINHTDDVVERTRRACRDLEAHPPKHVTSVPIKQTFLEAFATIQRREDDRRKSSKQEAKSKQQKKPATETNPQFRGTKIGVDPEVSAYWMVMEDYCRPVQASDLQLLLPQHKSLTEDTAFFMPPLGFNPTQDEAPETDDAHDGSTPADAAPDSSSMPTGQVAIKADPVDSTMHEATGGSAQEAALEHHNGPSLLHGASSVSMVKLLQVMASLFPEAGGEDSWHDLADAAAKEEGKVLDPALVDRVLSCVAKIEAPGGGESRVSKSEGLMGYMRILNCADQNSIKPESICSADSARTTMLQLLQSCIDRSSEQIVKSLPPIDAASALAGLDHTAKPEYDAAVVTEQHNEAVAPDEAIHPYLQQYLQRAVLRDHSLQEGRKSPSLAAAPGTPLTDHPDTDRLRAAAPAGPSTPTANGAEPASECARPFEEEAVKREAGQEGADGGADAAQPSQPDTREVSMDCSSMAHSMDCSADVKEAPTSTPGLAENNSAPPTTQQHRRSSRKRNRQERDGDGSSGAKPVKRGATPHAAIRESSVSRHNSAKGGEAGSTPGEDAPISAEPTARQKSTRAARSKGDARADGKADGKAELAGASCESDGALELVKDEAKVSAQPAAAEKESNAPNGAASGAPQAAQEHDSTVSTCCLEEQWANVNNGLDVLAIAPDDEVVAEIVSLQAELLQVATANRKRCASVLNAVLDDLPAQAEQQANQAKSEQEMESFLLYIRALKRQAKLEKREAERKEAAEALAAAGGQAGGTTATPAVVGRARRTAAKHAHVHASDDEDEDDESEDEVGGVPLPLAGASLVDPYALEVPDAINALCAVCGDGESKPNDQIVFCDRCNVAVHQHCYGVGEIPQGDWLCWPCRLHEDALKAEGKSQDDIRPPRFKESGNPDYPGGSKQVTCELCPMKRGIFKQTVPDADGQKKWVHVVCALWQTPEVSVAPVNHVEAISGLGNIKPEHSCMTCAYCRKRTGATVKCAHNKCHITFHPLCARKVGCFSVCHHSTGRGRPTYKTWCAQHSDAARRRERDAPARSAPVNGEKRATGGPKQPQLVSEVTVSKEDLVALEAELKAKNEALQFLKAVRYDLEAARILAAQVEKREKGKMHVVDLLKQEYEMVLANPRELVKYETFLSVKSHHNDLVHMMQSNFESKRMKARKAFVHQHQKQQLYLQQQQQQQAHPQRMHQVEPMPSMRVSGSGMPGSPGQIMYGQNGPQSMAPVRSMRMGGQVQGQAERMNQPQHYPAQHSSMLGARGGFGSTMIPSGVDGSDSLLRGLGGFDQPGNSPLVSPSRMLDPVSQQGGRHMMAREARFSQPQRMQGVSRMPMDPSGVPPGGGGGGMGNAWQHATHPHPGYNPHDLPSDHGMRSMHSTGGANQDMMPMNSNPFALCGDMPRQQHPGDNNLGRMPLAGGDHGMGSMREASMLPGGNQYHGMSHMGNGQQYRVQQMRTSDSAGYGAQPRQDGMGYIPQHSQDPGIQQSQGGFGAAPNTVTATRTGRSQRAAAQASRGRSYAERNDPFGYMDGYMDD